MRYLNVAGCTTCPARETLLVLGHGCGLTRTDGHSYPTLVGSRKMAPSWCPLRKAGRVTLRLVEPGSEL